jgi:hypothetical protein
MNWKVFEQIWNVFENLDFSEKLPPRTHSIIVDDVVVRFVTNVHVIV